MQPFFKAVSELPQAELLKTMEAGQKVASAVGGGSSAAGALVGIEEAVGQIHSTYVSLPANAQNSLINQAPDGAKSVLAVAREMKPEHVKSIAKDLPVVMKAMKKMESSSSSSTKHFPTIDKDAVGRIHKQYKLLTPKARKVFYTQLPKEAQPVAKAMTHLSTKQCVDIVGQLPDLANALQTVTGDGASQNGSGAADEEGAKTKRLDAAKKLFRVFKSIPEPARESLSELIPQEARGAVEMADGLSEDDVGVLLASMDEKSGKAPAKQEGKDGEEDEGKEQRRKALQGAKIIARAETRRLWRWVRSGPFGLRVLTFLTGLSLVFSGVLGMLLQTFNGFRIFAIGVCFYLILIGILVSSLEVKSAVCSTYVRAQVYKYFHFLSMMKARGTFLLFIGVASLSIVQRSLNWTEYLSIIASVFCCTVGLFTIISGAMAEGKLKNAKMQFKTEADLREAFNLMDEFGEGKLSPEKIKQMLNTYDPPTVLTDAELTAAINMLDSDHNGSVEVDELVSWYHGKPTLSKKDGPDQGQETQHLDSGGPGQSFIGRMYKGVMLLSAVVGLGLLVIGSVIGIINHLSGKKFELFSLGRILVDISIGACAFFGLFVEMHVRIRNLSFVQLVDKEAKFLSRMWGHGIFYMFLSTLALTDFDANETMNVVAGFLTLGVGLLHFIVGATLESAIRRRGEISYEDAEMAFGVADADSNGTIDSHEFPNLIKQLNIQNLNRFQLEAAFMSMDLDGDGGITKAEFLEWSQGKEHLDSYNNKTNECVLCSYDQPEREPLLDSQV
jgi:Ca2+-binding EF-hand superfamily protein